MSSMAKVLGCVTRKNDAVTLHRRIAMDYPKVHIYDGPALRKVAPAALAEYAVEHGWSKTEPYRGCAHVYEGDGLPEIVIPDHNNLGDYASTVSRLIEFWSERKNQSELVVYEELMNGR